MAVALAGAVVGRAAGPRVERRDGGIRSAARSASRSRWRPPGRRSGSSSGLEGRCGTAWFSRRPWGSPRPSSASAFALLDARSRLGTRRFLGPLSLIADHHAGVRAGPGLHVPVRPARVHHPRRLRPRHRRVLRPARGRHLQQVMAFTPIAFLVLAGVVRSLDVALEEAAQTLRATPWILLRTVTGPLLVPGLANAMLLVMIQTTRRLRKPKLPWAAATSSSRPRYSLPSRGGSTRTRRRCTVSSCSHWRSPSLSSSAAGWRACPS